MKRCPTCNRTYTDESLLFCADDGTQLVSAHAPAEPSNASPSSQPTIAFSPTPPPSSYQPTPKKRKWLALIALLIGLFALPFLMYSLSQPILSEFAFRNVRVERLVVSLWGVVTLFGTLLMILSLITAGIAIVLSIRQPARYGGKALAVVGPVLSILLMVLVIGAFAFRRSQGSTFDELTSNSNYNSNDNSNYNWNANSNRSSNYNSASNSNSSSTASDSTDESDDSTSMSERDKYRLFYAAAKSGDTSLQQRAARKVGIVDSSGMPSSTYQSFTKGMINWAFTDSAWVQTMDTPAKGRAYAEARLGTP